MRLILLPLLTLLLAASDARRAASDAPQTPDRAAASRPVAFIDVAVLPMNFDGILEHQTVVTMHGRIHEIGPVGEVEIPGSAIRIDGTGRYLMPGLADMHTHLDIELGDAANEAVLWLYGDGGDDTFVINTFLVERQRFA